MQDTPLCVFGSSFWVGHKRIAAQPDGGLLKNSHGGRHQLVVFHFTEFFQFTLFGFVDRVLSQ